MTNHLPGRGSATPIELSVRVAGAGLGIVDEHGVGGGAAQGLLLHLGGCGERAECRADDCQSEHDPPVPHRLQFRSRDPKELAGEL